MDCCLFRQVVIAVELCVSASLRLCVSASLRLLAVKELQLQSNAEDAETQRFLARSYRVVSVSLGPQPVRAGWPRPDAAPGRSPRRSHRILPGQERRLS